MSLERDALVYQDNDDDIILVLYMRLNAPTLKQALPMSYDSNKPDHNYLVACFKQGVDYIGQSSWDQIKEKIQTNNMHSLITSDYDTLHAIYDDLTIDTHRKLLEFATSQLNQ